MQLRADHVNWFYKDLESAEKCWYTGTSGRLVRYYECPVAGNRKTSEILTFRSKQSGKNLKRDEFQAVAFPTNQWNLADFTPRAMRLQNIGNEKKW